MISKELTGQNMSTVKSSQKIDHVIPQFQLDSSDVLENETDVIEDPDDMSDDIQVIGIINDENSLEESETGDNIGNSAQCNSEIRIITICENICGCMRRDENSNEDCKCASNSDYEYDISSDDGWSRSGLWENESETESSEYDNLTSKVESGSSGFYDNESNSMDFDSNGNASDDDGISVVVLGVYPGDYEGSGDECSSMVSYDGERAANSSDFTARDDRFLSSDSEIEFEVTLIGTRPYRFHSDDPENVSIESDVKDINSEIDDSSI